MSTIDRWIESGTSRSIFAPLYSNRRVIFIEAVLLLLLVWGGAARAFDAVDVISSPVVVSLSLYQTLLSGDWIPHFVESMRRILYGFTVALFVGVGWGIVLGVSDFWKDTLRMYVVVGLAMPGLFITIFAAMAFGTGNLTPMVATAILTVPFLADMVQAGVDDIDVDLLNMSAAFDVSKWKVYREVVFMSILPEIFSAIRFAFSVAWKITVLAEVVIGNSGIGFLIRENLNDASMTGVIEYLILFVAVMLLVEYLVFRQAEKRVFSWREDVKTAMSAGAT